MGRLAFFLCGIASSGILFAASVVQESVFSGDALPEGWTVSGDAVRSPEYSNTVTHISLSYSAAGGETAMFSIFAEGAGGAEKIADLSTLANRAEFDLAEGTDFRRFDIATNPAVELVSFSATWSEVSLLAIPASIARFAGYSENFNSLTNLATDSAWDDGLTVPYWRAAKGESAVAGIKVTYGTGNKSGGLYAYHGTNKNDTASYSLAAVANTSNRMKFGFAVSNDTGNAISGIGLAFTARQWTFTSRRTAAQSFRVSYLVTNEYVSVAADGDWRELEDMRFDAMDSLDSAGAAADYSTGSVQSRKETVMPLVLEPDEVMVFRWTPDPVSNGEAFGVDDVVLRCGVNMAGTVVHLAGAGLQKGGNLQ